MRQRLVARNVGESDTNRDPAIHGIDSDGSLLDSGKAGGMVFCFLTVNPSPPMSSGGGVIQTRSISSRVRRCEAFAARVSSPAVSQCFEPALTFSDEAGVAGWNPAIRQAGSPRYVAAAPLSALVGTTFSGPGLNRIPQPAGVNAKIALLDPKGETRTILEKAGVRAQQVDAGTDSAAYDISIVGNAALTAAGSAPDITRVRTGLKVILTMAV